MKKTIIINILLIALLIIGTTSVFADNKNNNPLLRELLIDGKEMEDVQFDPFITNYVLAIDKDKINIEAITDDPKAKAQIIGDTNLKAGTNDIEIKVTAEDGVTSQSYHLHITKGNAQKANANLKNIEVEGYTLNPTFNRTDIEYLVEYKGEIEKLNIKATPESDGAKVEILNNNNFSSTIHVVKIKVTAEDGITTKEYKIRAKRLEEEDKNSEYEKEYVVEEEKEESKTEKNENATESEEQNNEEEQTQENAEEENKIEENTVVAENTTQNENTNKESKNISFIVVVIVVGIIFVIASVIALKKYKK